ncbi:MAG: hypothetical protein CG442_1653, partial [Methylococcaceae bacterium NSO1]
MFVLQSKNLWRVEMHSHSSNYTPVTEQPSALITGAIMVIIVSFAILLSFQLYVDNV